MLSMIKCDANTKGVIEARGREEGFLDIGLIAPGLKHLGSTLLRSALQVHCLMLTACSEAPVLISISLSFQPGGSNCQA